jgi:hypothetical protein
MMEKEQAWYTGEGYVDEDGVVVEEEPDDLGEYSRPTNLQPAPSLVLRLLALQVQKYKY